MDLNSLTAISPVDGRYGHRTAPLRSLFSEFGLIRYRVLVEIRWLQKLARIPEVREVPGFSEAANRLLEEIIDKFSLQDAEQIKKIENRINHDVKAVEYFLKERFAGHAELQGVSEFLHFACTSEDVNNLCHAMMLREAKTDHLIPTGEQLVLQLADLAERHAGLAMVARTHGQTASPTTLGKEIALFAHRLHRQLQEFKAVRIQGKFNGAVGNFNAHLAAYPELDWPAIAESFVESLNISWNQHTTQIEPHDYMAEYCHALSRFNTILAGFCRDTWGYISLGYFRQKAMADETGSSTMPHKINPIDFENAEGNLGIANALLDHLAAKLPISRWQRDLTDSTTIRNTGPALAHCLIAWQSCLKGLARLEADPAVIGSDLEDKWEVLAEAIQTVMRRHAIEQPYEKLKKLTRGQAVTRESVRGFIQNLVLPEDAKQSLLDLSPENYTGNAREQALAIVSHLRSGKSGNRPPG